MSHEESPQLLQARIYMTELREIEEFIPLMEFTKIDNALSAIWDYDGNKKLYLVFRRSGDGVVRIEMNGVVSPLAKVCQEYMLEKFEELFPPVSLVRLHTPL